LTYILLIHNSCITYRKVCIIIAYYMINHGLMVSEGGVGIDGICKPGIFGIVGMEGMFGMAGIGGNVVGIVEGIVGILGKPGMPEIGGSAVGIVDGIVILGIDGIGGKVVGIVGIVGFAVVGAASGVAASVVSKRWRAAKLPLMAVKNSAKASSDQA
jgi:hypothetical protein